MRSLFEIEEDIAEKFFGKRVDKHIIGLDNFDNEVRAHKDDPLVVELYQKYDELLSMPMY